VSKKGKPNLAATEQAIEKKYGVEAIQNPNAHWTPEKEKDYLEQQEVVQQQKLVLKAKNEKVEVDGVFIPKKLLSKDTRRICPTCREYSFKSQDDVYMTKFDCCYKCYIQWIEDREERWKDGWRPNKE